MKAGMYNDDSQIDYIEIARGEAVKNGKAVINLNEFYGDTHGTSK
jgi:Holliday junction resolvase RusA-like endonuclease